MTDATFWIWLQTALGAGSIKVDRVIRSGISPENLYRMSEIELEETGLFSPAERKAMRDLTLEKPTKYMLKAKEMGCAVLTPEHPHFPVCFTHITPIPCVLYVQGDLAKLGDELLLTMVGTRRSSKDGEHAAMRLARDLAAAGCTVVSGLAVGIDCAAHEGALSLDARTIGFMGCGLDVNYPAGSADLKKRILAHNGVLISEFAFGIRAYPQNFNIRNRLLAGISAGVVVVEAPLRSGALNTARHALEQNKDIFAVPSGIFVKSFAGCNQLLEEGAKMVRNGYSILEEYIGRFPDTIDPRFVKPRIERAQRSLEQQAQERQTRGQQAELGRKASKPKEALVQQASLPDLSAISAGARKIYEVLCFEPADCCTIARSTDLLIMDIMAGLTELEVMGLARSEPGQRYAAIKE